MIKKLTVTILVLLFSSSLYAEFQMERVICTTKKTLNCGAYIYNTKTGEREKVSDIKKLINKKNNDYNPKSKFVFPRDFNLELAIFHFIFFNIIFVASV